MRLFLSVLTVFLLTGSNLPGRQITSVCGSHPDRWREELALHKKAVERRAKLAGAIGVASADVAPVRPATRDSGEIVLMEASDGVVSRRNDFDLDARTIAFQPSDVQASGYRFTVMSGGYDAGEAAAGTVISGLGDDDARQFHLGFPFPFFGRQYTDIYVNSDGNLTFTVPDTSQAVRSLGRVTSGPPRIAPLFSDLDPRKALDGIRVLNAADRFVVSWVAVPEYSSFGRGPLQTFQVTLYPDGRIEFAYNGITGYSSVVGIAPGGLQGTTSVVSFTAGGDKEFTAAVLERFTRLQEVDTILAAQKFYEAHDDAYDFLVFYNDLNISAAPGAVAFEVPIRNHRTGYGDPLIDVGALYGSPRRLQALLNMGPLSQYPDDPNAVLPVRAASRDTSLTILGHEAGHMFLAYASIRDPNNPAARPMLGRQLAHWNFSFNSEASLLEGNRICDRVLTPESCPHTPMSGRFVTTATVEGYSPLDQYLMGLRSPEEVPDTFLVEHSSITNPSRMPQAGVAFDGTRRDIRIDEIISAEGRRTPDQTVSQRHFRFAFVLIVAEGATPPAETLQKLDTYRREFETYFRHAAGDRAWAETRLRRALHLSIFPASGLLLGSTATLTVSVEETSETDLQVLLTSANGAAGLRASVIIPAGSTSASVVMTGMRAGVDEITANIPGDGYQTAHSKVQVLASPSQLRLVVVSGDKQSVVPDDPLPEPIVIRVTDTNNLPYPSVRVKATPSAGGTAIPEEAVTDAAGKVSFDWIPAPAAANELHITLPDLAGSPVVTVTAIGKPAFAANGVVDAARFATLLSPGTLATIFGANLAGGKTASATPPLPTELAGVRVLLNDQAAQLLYVGDSQINFVAPADLAPGTCRVVVHTAFGETAVSGVRIGEVSPGIFVVAQDGLGAVTVAGTGVVTSERPAAPGDYLEIYATGLGAVQPSGIPGLSETVRKPSVSIAGLPVEVPFSGLAPGWPGLYQINVRVPDGVPSGRQTLSLTIGGVSSNEVSIQVR